MPKKYIVKKGENLDVIANRFKIPFWKYLYELNKDIIGDNPDILNAGTELQIPVLEES
ncbi:MAG: LysM peptidoglycan-binding domain-containing protein, partial [Bacteroidales bacterium]|nr:LysM peptidoglycan-binding domain-containing protein [Bacteroidales bacterium]